MLFTIAIPTYNNEKTIAGAVRSALGQSYPEEFEVLVVNNASTDGTLEEITRCNDQKLRVISNPDTVGMYENHNICLEQAKGDYVLFCHSDDSLCEDALVYLRDVIEKRHYPKKYIVWGHSMFRDYQENLKHCGQQINTVLSGMPALDCFYRGGVSPSGTCYSRESMIKIGGFPTFDAKIQLSDWYVLIFCVFQHFEFEMIDRLLFIREYGSTALNNMVWKDWWPNYRVVLDKLEETLDPMQLSRLISYIKQDTRFYPWLKSHWSFRQRVRYILYCVFSQPLSSFKHFVLHI